MQPLATANIPLNSIVTSTIRQGAHFWLPGPAAGNATRKENCGCICPYSFKAASNGLVQSRERCRPRPDAAFLQVHTTSLVLLVKPGRVATALRHTLPAVVPVLYMTLCCKQQSAAGVITFTHVVHRQLVRSLDCNLLCYDYAGYGQSTGDSPTVSDTYADIDACLAWLLSNGHELHDIVLYGQSVGSGPSVNLAARTPGIAGMVLHSPLCSGVAAS